MKRPATTIVAAAVVAGALMIGVTAARRVNRESPCGPGFVREGPRCMGPEPAPAIVDVPAVTVTIGPSDWEAEGRVAPRTLKTAPFRLDRYEVSVGRACASAVFAGARFCASDPGRAASGVTLAKARAFCKERNGRLPTEDEWIAAAAGDKPRRYPWGDTGAVCRRAAFGLEKGPCASGATGPDTVGAHPEGATPLGIHDLAGNVAEWVEPVETGGPEAVRGGAWDTELATELRTWVRRTVRGDAEEPTIGFRCAYDVATPSPPR